MNKGRLVNKLFIISILIVLGLGITLVLAKVSNDDTAGLMSQGPVAIKREDLQNSYFVFLNGVRSSCYDNYGNMSFTTIRAELRKAGYIFCDDRFILYSYTGGQMTAGKWCPNPYGPKDTVQPLSLSISHLSDLLDELSQAHPEAGFVLIGHSLGGRVAFDYLSVAKSEIRERIKAVITLDSPLLGAGILIPGFIQEIMDEGNVWRGPAVQQLIAEAFQVNKMTQFRKDILDDEDYSEIRIATFGSYQDLLVGPLTSCLYDEKNNPMTDGNIVHVPFLSLGDLFNHVQIIDNPEVIKYILSLLDI